MASKKKKKDKEIVNPESEAQYFLFLVLKAYQQKLLFPKIWVETSCLFLRYKNTNITLHRNGPCC